MSRWIERVAMEKHFVLLLMVVNALRKILSLISNIFRKKLSMDNEHAGSSTRWMLEITVSYGGGYSGKDFTHQCPVERVSTQLNRLYPMLAAPSWGDFWWLMLTASFSAVQLIMGPWEILFMAQWSAWNQSFYNVWFLNLLQFSDILSNKMGLTLRLNMIYTIIALVVLISKTINYNAMIWYYSHTQKKPLVLYMKAI